MFETARGGGRWYECRINDVWRLFLDRSAYDPLRDPEARCLGFASYEGTPEYEGTNVRGN